MHDERFVHAKDLLPGDRLPADEVFPERTVQQTWQRGRRVHVRSDVGNGLSHDRSYDSLDWVQIIEH